MTDFVIRGVALNGFETVLDELGGNSQALTDALDLPPVKTLINQEVIDYKYFVRLMNAAAEQTENPYFGYLVSQRKDPRLQYGIISLVAQTSSSLGEAIRYFIHYLKLQTRTSASDLHIEGNKAFWKHTIHYPGEESLFQVYFHAMGVGLSILRILTQDSVKPEALHCSFKEPEGSHLLRRYFKMPIFYNAGFDALEIASSHLTQPLAEADPDRQKALLEEINSIVTDNSHDFALKLKTIIARAMDIGDPSIDRVAKFLACNKRTLQRKLDKMGLSYKQLLDDVRLARAKHYLQYSNLSLINIADLLDYNDQSSFSRFFNKQEGLSPLKWRKQNQKSP
ncbi:ornithine utilization transcriptional regulator OruR [Maricurvus nonylphenolicus]|uniref:helix-turn-helix domain-containing protein n=1 Tax=Maricurvus nonylphenolicus TaxID=1008307 RepID=UPI0036F1BBBC